MPHTHTYDWDRTVWYDLTDPQTGERSTLVTEAGQIVRPCKATGTKKACEDRMADWQAMQAVMFAYRQVLKAAGDTKRQWWQKDRSSDATLDVQLMQYINGDRAEITNKEGNPSQAPFTKRVRRAIERFKAGDLPSYNLYGGLADLQSLAAAHVGQHTEQEADMPYRNGRRVSNEEWSSGNLTQLHTGPRGENPGEPFTVEAVEGSKGADEGDNAEDKMVYGVEVLDKDEVLTQEIDTESTSGDRLSGDLPGEGSGEDRDLEAAEVDEDEGDGNVSGSAVEAEAEFVEDAKEAAADAEADSDEDEDEAPAPAPKPAAKRKGKSA